MAELLTLVVVLVVIAGMVLLYAADRARKLQARARRMGAMNDRLDVAAAKVDEQQERKQARVKASAELTSVMPAIKRPRLTLPGVPGPAAGPGEEDPAAAEQEAGPAGGHDTPAAAGAGSTPDGAAMEESPAAQTAPDAGDSPAEDGRPAAEDIRAAAEEATPEPVGTPEGTLTMGRVVPDATSAPKLQVTPDGTMIMPPVPGQARAPAGEAGPPAAPSRAGGRPWASQQSTNQEQANRH